MIASLFRHYVDFLAPWYDLNDSKNLFGTTVPTRALNNAILFKAIIAFAACHQHRVSGKLAGLGPVYHAACVNDLLAEIHDIHLELLGDYLAATCLLRSYEILNGIHTFHRTGSHLIFLQGIRDNSSICSGHIPSRPVDPLISQRGEFLKQEHGII